VVVLAVLTAAQTLEFKITGLLALGGVGGIAVGFAAKDLLANFFGGLTIYLDRPFSVGEWIRSPDKSIEGTVEYISWRHTRVRAFNKNPIYVPNAVFTSIVVENPSRMSHRRIRETLGLRYDDFAVVAPIVADIKEMLRAHEGIDATQTLIVNFNQFGASSLDILIYTFTRTIVWVEYHAVKQDVLLKIGEIVARHGAEIAFPTHTVHVPDRIAVAADERAEMPRPRSLREKGTVPFLADSGWRLAVSGWRIVGGQCLACGRDPGGAGFGGAWPAGGIRSGPLPFAPAEKSLTPGGHDHLARRPGMTAPYEGSPIAR
jgi:small-conductance mechanosensitive channel